MSRAVIFSDKARIRAFEHVECDVFNGASREKSVQREIIDSGTG